MTLLNSAGVGVKLPRATTALCEGGITARITAASYDARSRDITLSLEDGETFIVRDVPFDGYVSLKTQCGFPLTEDEEAQLAKMQGVS